MTPHLFAIVAERRVAPPIWDNTHPGSIPNHGQQGEHMMRRLFKDLPAAGSTLNRDGDLNITRLLLPLMLACFPHYRCLRHSARPFVRYRSAPTFCLAVDDGCPWHLEDIEVRVSSFPTPPPAPVNVTPFSR